MHGQYSIWSNHHNKLRSVIVILSINQGIEIEDRDVETLTIVNNVSFVQINPPKKNLKIDQPQTY